MLERNSDDADAGRFVMTRTFAAPRERVFEAWSKPEHIASWWGPRGFTMPACEVDLRAGGAFRFVMRGPDGADYPFDGMYESVDPPSRLVFHGTLHDGVRVRTSVTFEDRGAQTLVTVEQTYSAETDATRGAPVGWTQTLDRFAAFLAARR
jgi:uncharacterized protein YndB with AHSA1/START domain